MASKTRNLPGASEGKRGTQGHIGYLLRQAHGALRGALDAALVEAGLTTPQFLVLTLLDAYPGASGADIARIAQLTPQTVNLIVRKLADGKLLGRNEHETHGRVTAEQQRRPEQVADDRIPQERQSRRVACSEPAEIARIHAAEHPHGEVGPDVVIGARPAPAGQRLQNNAAR